MVLFAPDIANSQVLFCTRIAEKLVEAGHDVTVVILSSDFNDKSNEVKIINDVKVYRVNASFGLDRKQVDEDQEKFVYADLPLWDSRFSEHLNLMTSILLETCRKVLENKKFLEWLPQQKFDLAFAHMIDTCTIGLIHYARIPSWIWLNSGALMDFVAYYMGVPIIPSYIPPMMMDSTDRMNFIERVKSFIGYPLTLFIWKRKFADPYTALYRELIDPNFPDTVDIAKSCPLVMVNSDELYEGARPTLSKIINIGGIGMKMKDAKPLSQVLQRIVDDSLGLVVFSFGSVAPSQKMPLTWKNALLNAFRRFPKYRFVMAYDGEDLQDRLPSNVYVLKWIPQTDLLAQKKTKVFISHGGYNSIQESIIAGVPMITIPLFGDQLRNAKIAEKYGISVNLRKSDVTADNLINAIKKLLSDESYSKNIKRFSSMVKKKPVSAEHLLIAWAEFAAEFRKLDNLVPAGNNLNFFAYHSLDVIAYLFLLLVLVLIVFWKLLVPIIGLICLLRCSGKQKKS